MVAQARKARSALLFTALTAIFILVLLPAVNILTGQDELHAAVRHANKQASVQKHHAAAPQQHHAITATRHKRNTAPSPAPAPDDPDFITSESPDELISTSELMIEKLVMQIEKENEQRSQSKSSRGTDKSILEALPSIRPIDGVITSEFGMREHPVYRRILFHTGTDFSAPVGTKVMVTADGTVAFSGFDRGYGKKVVIDHGNGYLTIYAHLSKAVIRQGQHVRQGDTIAFSGNTGLSTGPHLHYEVRKDNIVVNPTAFFQNDMTSDKFLTQHDLVPEQDSHS